MGSSSRGPRSVVLGTAGHIDHGKTTLVKALTGTDTDRLPEEKRRGITIELGFAPWVMAPGIEASIIDVPGHEGFVRTMVAGAGGIDAMILVVSAEDGVMPQTREHLNVCELLGVGHGVVALTQVDRLEGDAESIELAVDDVREGLTGTVFEDAQIVPCSGVTGEGLDELKKTLLEIIARVPRRELEGPPIMPLDRVFTMKGHGTVVTGTLLVGTVDLGSETQLLLVPAGARREPREVRARALQIRSSAHAKALAGSRVALNLAGVELSEIQRGDVITLGRQVMRADAFHAELMHMPHSRQPWKNGTSLQVCGGTAHSVGRLDPLSEPVIVPGGRGLIRIRLDAPMPVWRDQRIIVRSFNDPAAQGASASENQGRTVGGGTVIDPEPSGGRRQRKRWTAIGRALGDPDAPTRVRALIEDAGVRGIEVETLERRAGVVDAAKIVATMMGKKGDVDEVGNHRYVHRTQLRPLIDAAIAVVDRFHAKNPMQPGLGRAAVEGQLPGAVAPDVAARAVALAVERGALRLADDQGSLARPGKGLSASGQLPPQAQKVLDAYVESGIQAPTLKNIEQRCQLASRQVLEIVGLLQRAGKLVRITSDLSFARDSHDALVEEVKQHLRDHGTIDVQALKGMTGLSRKYAVPFLEHLDQIHVTSRRGDVRVPGPKA